MTKPYHKSMVYAYSLTGAIYSPLQLRYTKKQRTVSFCVVLDLQIVKNF